MGPIILYQPSCFVFCCWLGYGNIPPLSHQKHKLQAIFLLLWTSCTSFGPNLRFVY